MNRKLILVSLIVLIITAAVVWGRSVSAKETPSAPISQPSAALVAGPGRVEPVSEEVKLAAEISGKLKRVFVEEGDRIQRGQVLAELQNDDYRAQVDSAQAIVGQREAELRKVLNGARREERLRELSSVHEAEAVMNNARGERERHKKLLAAGVISQEEADHYAKEYDVAEAQYQSKIQSHALVDEATREEDRSAARANLAAAQAQLEEARALLAKTFIRSPLDGRVLRKYHRAGESVSNGATAPDPVFSVGDDLALRVRVDVDETEVSKLRVGQRAYVTADAYGQRQFWGQIVRVGQELGRKNFRTDEPTERVDTKILETLVQLDENSLPVGLRVNAFILTGEGGHSTAK